jgi:carboxypeptidase C (cathepsin A)
LQTHIKGGYVTRYGGAGVNDFYYLTINGAGHMVPYYKPEPAYDMITRFTSRQPF